MDAADRWRVIDTGLRTPLQNAALDRALLEAREADEISGTLRFLRYTPSVLLGALQDGDPLLNAQICKARGLPLERRLTDGGTFVCESPHLAWSLYLARKDVEGSDGRDVLRRLCHAAAAGVSALGVGARYRGRNEIVVDGRTLAQAGLLYSDHAVLFQAVLTLDGDAASRAELYALPWPIEERRQLITGRLTTLREQLGRKPDAAALRRNLVEAYESEFGVELRDADLTLSEHARFETAQRELAAGEPERVVPARVMRTASAVCERDGGRLSACVVCDESRVVHHVWFAGCTASPAAAVPDLEAALRGVPGDAVDARVRSFFASRPVRCDPWTAADFAAVVKRAVDQPLLAS